MNKLIIIGNGIDLHNGLKSDYQSFIKWLIRNKCEEGLKTSHISKLGFDLIFASNFIGSHIHIYKIQNSVYDY